MAPSLLAEAPKGWGTDYDAALARAAKEKRPVLALFTGSDWCPYCVQLEKKVLKDSLFQKFAEKNVVLLYLDFPRKKQHDVLHVFQHTRSGNRAFLGHMPDEKTRASRRLCHAHQHAGAFAHLRNAARRARHVRTIHRLDGIDNHIIRRKLFPAAFGGGHRVFAQHKQVFALDAQPPPTQFDLPNGFLTRNIQDPRPSSSQLPSAL